MACRAQRDGHITHCDCLHPTSSCHPKSRHKSWSSHLASCESSREGRKFPYFPSHCLNNSVKLNNTTDFCFTLVIFSIPNSSLSLSAHYSSTNKSILTLYGSSLLCHDEVGVSYEIFIHKLAACLSVQRDIVSYDTYIHLKLNVLHFRWSQSHHEIA